jgi:Lon protease-like protein
LTAFHPRLEDLPAEIAIFPLAGALLLPGGKLPLNIFEPRYLAMTLDSLGQGRMFGMVQGDPGRARDERGSAIFGVGCLGRLSSFAETEDGRLLITLTGVIRFRIAEEIAMRHGYRRVRADYGTFVEDLVPPPPVTLPREAILAALRPYFQSRGIEANWAAIEAMPDALLVTTLAMVCPFGVPEKQALLEAETLTDRSEILIALMQMDAHGDDGPNLPS